MRHVQECVALACYSSKSALEVKRRFAGLAKEYVCMHIYTVHTLSHTRTRARAHTHTHTHTHIHTHIYIYIGYDYNHQVDYLEVWGQVVEAFQQVCDAYPDIKVWCLDRLAPKHLAPLLLFSLSPAPQLLAPSHARALRVVLCWRVRRYGWECKRNDACMLHACMRACHVKNLKAHVEHVMSRARHVRLDVCTKQSCVDKARCDCGM